jgi:hypothetical protein
MIAIFEEEGMFRIIVDGERGPLYPDRQSALKAGHAILDLMDQISNAMYGEEKAYGSSGAGLK